MIIVRPAPIFFVAIAVIIPVIRPAMTFMMEMFVLFFTPHSARHQQKTKPN